jgi:hypothetical protein
MIHIEALPRSKFETIRTLRLRGPKWQEFTGSISYSRPLTEEYNGNTIDILDEAILESIAHYSIEVTLATAHQIMFTHQKEHIAALMRRYPSVAANFQFTPYVEHESYSRILREGTELYAYPVELPITVLYCPEKELDTLPTFFLCSVPYEQLTPKIIRTLKPVRFE